MRRLVLLLSTLVVGCQEPSSNPSPGSARPSAVPPPVATATASAAASASGWPDGRPLKQLLGTASRVKVSEMVQEGSRVEMKTGILDDPKDLETLLVALGKDQVPAEGCVRCMPSVTLAFEDAAGARLGAVGLFCDEGSTATQATLRDGAGDHCHLLKLADVESTRGLVKKGRSAAGSASARASASAAPSAPPRR